MTNPAEVTRMNKKILRSLREQDGEIARMEADHQSCLMGLACDPELVELRRRRQKLKTGDGAAAAAISGEERKISDDVKRKLKQLSRCRMDVKSARSTMEIVRDLQRMLKLSERVTNVTDMQSAFSKALGSEESLQALSEKTQEMMNTFGRQVDSLQRTDEDLSRPIGYLGQGMSTSDDDLLDEFIEQLEDMPASVAAAAAAAATTDARMNPTRPPQQQQQRPPQSMMPGGRSVFLRSMPPMNSG